MCIYVFAQFNWKKETRKKKEIESYLSSIDRLFIFDHPITEYMRAFQGFRIYLYDEQEKKRPS